MVSSETAAALVSPEHLGRRRPDGNDWFYTGDMAGRRSFLLTGAAALVGFIASPTFEAEDKQVKKLTADDLKTLLKNKPKLFFLDVREPKEIEQLGTIRGYVNIPISQLERRYSEIPKDVLIVTA
jgi:hypothetical protein